VIQLPIFARTRLQSLIASARSTVCFSRLLLLFIALEAITMPITQGLWSWDKFLHGGQDFELGLLIIVSCLCLVLLRVQQNRSCFGWLTVIWALLTSAQRHIAARPSPCAGSVEHRSQIPSQSSARAFNLPLLI